MIKFVVLESNRLNGSRHYARIHRASCGYAKEPNHKTASTLCHGYFDRYHEALDFAKSLNVKKVYTCENCSPRHADELAMAILEAKSS
ncbi:hypothetical protein ES703_16534 [subsurface metagenome]